MLPFVGFCVIRISGLDYTYGIMLQVVTACPGGAYSNWWCSLFNADLLLSVTSTAVATVLSAGLLPLNLLLYLSIGYDVNAINSLRFDLLLVTVAVVITAVVGGALTSIHLFPRFPACARDPQRTRDRCSHLGNFCGLCLVIFSFIFSSVNEPIWNREGVFYAAVAMPPICALVLSSGLSSLPLLALSKPSRCAITVECTFQNVSLHARRSYTNAARAHEPHAHSAEPPRCVVRGSGSVRGTVPTATVCPPCCPACAAGGHWPRRLSRPLLGR